MSIAVTHGKISRSGANLTSASEDLLTASVFGPLRYLPASELLIPILKMAKTMAGDSLVIKSSEEPIVNFWPSLDNSEPDVMIKLGDHVLMIEAKYLAGKSGDYFGKRNGDEREAQASRDQLAREFQDLQQQSGTKQSSLIYLTAHRVLPEKSMQRSIEAANVKRKINAIDVRDNLYWLSWCDVWKQAADYNSENLFHNQIVSDIRDYLERLNLNHFTGFSSSKVDVPMPGDKLFYRS